MSENASDNPCADGPGTNPSRVPARSSPDISPSDQKVREQPSIVELPNIALSHANGRNAAEGGLRRLCTLLANINSDKKPTDVLGSDTGQIVPTNLKEKFLS